MRNTIITLNPFVGHRFLYHRLNFDLLAGIDLALCLQSREKGNATVNSKEDNLKVNNKNQKPSIDFRPGIQLKTQYDKFGFILGYSLGLVNFQKKNNSKAFTDFLKVGLSYKIN
ncbi:MAG: hypothetical protein ABI266_04875 [Ginsengibacter sp.]